MSLRVLAVDDNFEALAILEDILLQEGYEVVTASSGDETLFKVAQFYPDVILLDVQMPEPDGYQVTRMLKSDERFRYIPIILLTAKTELIDIVFGFDQGADDYIKKPYNQVELIARLQASVRTRRLYEELRTTLNQNSELKQFFQDQFTSGKIIGRSEVMLEVYRTIEKVSDSSASILITGESGTGKELVAQAIHFNSGRKSSSFIAQNVSAFNDNLLESELFGHVKGAFTGAVKDKQGLFLAANGGTLFLDELGEMSPTMQAKLLRVLQEGTFIPVGDTKVKKVDVRVIGATHRDLQKMISEGTFREDLYYRLNVVQIALPPLRERKTDISLLASVFLDQAVKRNGSVHKRFSSETLKILGSYNWPGNVRQLQNEIERLVLMSGKDEEITPAFVSREVKENTGSQNIIGEGKVFGKLKDAIENLEKIMIQAALEKFDWNKSEVARELGVSRSNLISKVQAYGLNKK